MFRISYIVKNLIIINVVVFIVFGFILPQFSYYVEAYYPGSREFLPVQLIGHMFMHGDLMHIFFNMFMLYMFGTILENYWGSKFFLFFYLVSGFGAISLHMLVKYITLQTTLADIPPDMYQMVYEEGRSVLTQGRNYLDSDLGKLNVLLNVPAVGASGAVYGLLAGFGLQYPRHKLMLIFPPIPIEARIFIPILIIFEFFAGINGGSNIAHFAHIGGALFGFILFKFRHKINL
jgi:membrane associated rhomboid family serine protease